MPTPQSHTFPVTRTAHYYTLGHPSAQVRQLWICCHGYGQLASHFIHKFRDLQGPHTLIIAPEGLSRFYFGGVVGPVGASWMTSADRLSEIHDYCNWLDALYDRYTSQLSPEVHITFLGFSQGVATVLRWMHARQRRVDRVIAWAGTLPEDLDYRPLAKYWHDVEWHLVYPDADAYLSPQRLAAQSAWMEAQDFPKVHWHTYPGTHRIDRSELGRLFGKGV